MDARRFKGVEINRRMVVEDFRRVTRDEAHATHIRGKRVHGLYAAGGLERVLSVAQIHNLELVRLGGAIFGIFEVYTPHPVSGSPQTAHQVMADESAGAGHQDS